MLMIQIVRSVHRWQSQINVYPSPRVCTPEEWFRARQAGQQRQAGQAEHLGQAGQTGQAGNEVKKWRRIEERKTGRI